MHKTLIVLGLILFSSAASLAAPSTFAAPDATCQTTPSVIGPFEPFTTHCSGFDPNKMVWVYETEPDGTAFKFGSLKVNEKGEVTFNDTNGEKPFFTLHIGVWAFTVEQLGPGGPKVHQAISRFRISGGREGVSGAGLTSNKTRLHRDEEFVLHGSGFAPFETVTAWFETPDNCSSYTSHFVDGNNGGTFENQANIATVGTRMIGNVEADGSGAFEVTLATNESVCNGVYRIVARGNSSGRGAYVDLMSEGNRIETNASLIPSKSSVFAFADTITFQATGFGASEKLNCWTTSPEGRALPFGADGSLSAIGVAADGRGVIRLTTGAHLVTPDDDFAIFGNQALMSEGSLGFWALTCKGAVSGDTATAVYKVTGGVIDP